MKLIQHSKAFLATVMASAYATVASAQVITMPSAPLPAGVTSSSNPIEQAVSIGQHGAKLGFYFVAVLVLLGVAYYGYPAIVEWRNNKKSLGEAAGVIIGLLILGVVIIGFANYGATQIGGAAAANP